MKKFIDFICMVFLGLPATVVSYVAHWAMAGWAAGEYLFDPEAFNKRYKVKNETNK